MITKAFKWFSSKRRNITGSMGPEVIHVTQKLKGIDGTEFSESNALYQGDIANATYLMGVVYNEYNTGNWGSTNGICGLTFGTGTTAPTEDDYFLESYVSDFTFGSAAYRAVNQTDQYGVYDEIIASYTYTGSSDVTITEVGYVGQVRKAYNGSFVKILIDRSLLNPGVTLHQGEAITISLKLYHTGAIALS